jgi:hypothetical protein
MLFTGDEENVCKLVIHALSVDSEARTSLLHSITLFLTHHKIFLSLDGLSLFFDLFTSVFSSALPYTCLQKGYRQFYFTPCAIPEDVHICYDFLSHIIATPHDYPLTLLESIVRRLASASLDDRTIAKDCLLRLPNAYFPQLLHFITVLICPAPPHGVDLILNCISNLIDHSTCLDAAPLAEIEIALRHLHLAPHIGTFHNNLIGALKSLHAKDPDIAHRTRRFLLARWPRLEPLRAVLFMQEAIAICLSGPPIEADVWERFAWRSSSIQWQLANEGLSFVQQTIGIVPGAGDATLRFLLEDTAKSHWSATVRERAGEVMALLPAVEPVGPRPLRMDRWNLVRSVAKANFPTAGFVRRKQTRK